MTDSSEAFLFDDFFVSDGDGFDTTIQVKGRDIPIRVRPLSSSDQIAIQAEAVSKRIDQDGTVRIDKFDEAKGSSLLLARGIVSWPFVHKDGTPVEITPDNCSKLLGEAAGQITRLISHLSGQKDTSPFESSSVAA
jgi:hypothetical protein